MPIACILPRWPEKQIASTSIAADNHHSAFLSLAKPARKANIVFRYHLLLFLPYDKVILLFDMVFQKMAKSSLTFQQIILTLQEFWSKQGCTITQPLDMEMGAGTFHPNTFLRSIGPEPWHAAYVQPSRRPTDGRYGDNPNRLQHYYQFQVILKPVPDDIQSLYLASLQTLGIDAQVDDIRFVEDNWESPTLGASGTGWEVWQNGMEITQFTYFQQVGGLPCHPITGEITYGLERLAMHLQDVDNVYDIVWSEGMTYGDLFHQNEVEMSHYNFTHAAIDDLNQQFNQHEAMCMHLVKQSLPLPGYEQVLKASHTFNLLDARHALSVTERQAMILRIRKLAFSVAQAYLDKRETMGFPLLEGAHHDS